MEIRNNVLVKVDDCDINSDGTFTFPEGVTSIGDSAFAWCISLKGIKIPEYVTSIGDSAFYNCTSLEQVIMPEGAISIEKIAFFNCISLEKVILPAGVTSIGTGIFDECESLTSLSIGNINVIKLYEASKQAIEGVAYSSCFISDAAAFATLSEFFITDGNFSFKCNYENNTFSIENATFEVNRYAQKILMPLLLQIQAQRAIV